jgi:hypothetical protein
MAGAADQTLPVSDEAGGQHLPASPGQHVPEIVFEDAEERITLLPCETGRAAVAEYTRSTDNTSLRSDAEMEVPSHHSVTLPKSYYISWMVLMYAALALAAWKLICLLTFTPLTTEHYGFDPRQRSL